MNQWEHKHTREIRSQEFSPGDDWELVAAPDWVDFAYLVSAGVALVLFLVLANGGN